ncbi:hypothetical protein I7I53_02020 [Histoplasma capsulatum var. duboisii H88]|uniref:Uncharacterized protein n=1 Tax=Ajellomyces capsulatus (strain H88) TaxID=544711 RepID=A0A8A1LKD6_AJEC8|nr:hypothetical protein I7I53_02020 [Histoplasma capsulatum var. duboisii H88]
MAESTSSTPSKPNPVTAAPASPPTLLGKSTDDLPFPFASAFSAPVPAPEPQAPAPPPYPAYPPPLALIPASNLFKYALIFFPSITSLPNLPGVMPTTFLKTR